MTARDAKLLLTAGLCAGLLACAGAAHAGEEKRGFSRCEAEYGPGYAATAEGSACMWVGGHVRVGFGARRGSLSDVPGEHNAMRVNAGESAAPASGLAPMSGRLRLNEGPERVIVR
ncbi:hypothetical protein [Methylocella sp.]|uniref:hypothetical protein n=1 Tax=Methylocella sp. TaxID=1978226 RepID=UPI0037847831